MTTALVPTTQISAQDPAARLLALFLAGKSPHTIRAYHQDLGRLAAFLGVSGTQEAAAALLSAGQGGANAMALQFSNHLQAAGMSPSTINRALTSLCSMVKVGRMTGMIPWTLDVVRVESQAYRDTAGPGREVIQKMLAAVKDDPAGKRNAAIIGLLYGRGLRRGEVVSLDVGHFDERKSALSIMGKKRKEREWVGLSVTSFDAIKAWLTVHPFARRSLKTPSGVLSSAPLFVSLDRAHFGERLSGNGVLHIISTLGALVGAKARPHGLRHSAITDVLDRSGGDMRKAQKFSRHRSADTLNIYDDNRQDFGREMADLLEDK